MTTGNKALKMAQVVMTQMMEQMTCSHENDYNYDLILLLITMTMTMTIYVIVTCALCLVPCDL